MPGSSIQEPLRGRIVVAGATGALGNEVLRLLVGTQAWRDVQVLAREPIMAGLRGVGTHVVGDELPTGWAPLRADAAVVMFEPPRLFYDRERALWTPLPEQLVALAEWLRVCGVAMLAIVLPHAQMRLPESLKRGLAGLDEHAVAALGFERLLIVRSAQKPPDRVHRNVLHRIAHGMLSVGQYMVPSSEQPVRALKVAQFVAAALELAPPGIHVAASETVWQAAQGDVRAGAARWLDGRIATTS